MFAVISHDQRSDVNGWVLLIQYALANAQGEMKRRFELMIENVRKHLIEFTD